MKVYPPYGRSIAALIARGVKPACVGVLLSERWPYYQNVARVCIKPDEWAPGRWEFGFLRNMHVVAILGEEAEGWQFGGLLVDLMRASPALLWICDITGRWIYKDDDWGTVHEYATHTLADGKHATWQGPKYHETHGAKESYRQGVQRAIALEVAVMKRAEEKVGDAVQAYSDIRARKTYVERLFAEPYAQLASRAA